jgi:hypothetical protein
MQIKIQKNCFYLFSLNIIKKLRIFSAYFDTFIIYCCCDDCRLSINDKNHETFSLRVCNQTVLVNQLSAIHSGQVCLKT